MDSKLIGQYQAKHRHSEWLKFLFQINRETSKHKDLHLACDNDAAHKHSKVKDWLTKHPRFHIHFTPTSASWSNMVERFFQDITTQRLRCDVFTSVPDLIAIIDAYIDQHNQDPKPFFWIQSPTDILQKITRANQRLSAK